MAQTIENLDDVVDFSKMTQDEKKEFVQNILKRKINIAKGDELWLVFFDEFEEFIKSRNIDRQRLKAKRQKKGRDIIQMILRG